MDSISEKGALGHLMDLLAVEGISGQEREVAAVVKRKLRKAGLRPSWMRHDDAHRRISPDFQVGNLIVKLPGTVKGQRRLFMGHLDTVPLCRGAVPVLRGRRIVPAGKTALGGDNRTSVACLVTLLETLLTKRLPHPPITAVFTIAEEIGLRGSAELRVRDLGSPKLGINIDSGRPSELIVGAIGADRWEAAVHGRSAHAGVHPEHGISAVLMASKALEEVAARGYFGKIVKGKRHGASNVGRIEGGEATNQVTDFVRVTGECRSHDPRFLQQITTAYRRAFERAARSVKNHRRQTGQVRFRAERSYDAFRIGEDSGVVEFACRVARALKLGPTCIVVNGGIDASALNQKGIPTVTVGAGQHGAHTLGEYVDVKEFLTGCRFVLALATTESDGIGTPATGRPKRPRKTPGA